MSVLIRGMEMPDKCGHCRFATAFECEVTKNFITTFNVRQADCPLVPVPPHGNLIDLRSVNLEDGPYEYQDWVEWALDQYLNAPIFIPAEEGETRNGNWSHW